MSDDHGENARPLCPSGVDNQTNYVHSPPKGCTATPRPKVMSLSLLWDCPCLYVLDLFQSQPLSGKGSPGERSAFPEKDSSPLFCVLSPSLAHLWFKNKYTSVHTYYIKLNYRNPRVRICMWGNATVLAADATQCRPLCKCQRLLSETERWIF